MDLNVYAVTIAVAVAAGSLWMIHLFLAKWRNVASYPPVVGTTLSHMMNFDRLHDYHTRHAHRHATFRVVYPSFSYVYTAHPPNVEHVLKTNFANYVKGDANYDTMKELLGDGIFSVDGDKWRHQRRLTSLEFSSKAFKEFSAVVFRHSAIRLASILAEAATANQTVEMQDLLMRLTLDAICKVTLGLDVKSLSKSNSGPEADFAEAFDTSNALAFRRYVDVFWRIRRYFNIGSEAVMRKNIKIVDDFVYGLIQSRRQELFGCSQENVKPDLLSRFISLTEKGEEKLSDKYLRDVILNLVIAGRDTTAITLSWFLHMLCNHPEVEEKLVQEISRAVQNHEETEPGTMAESIDAFAQCLIDSEQGVLDKMHYLHAALSETLRLYPAVPVDGKYIVCDDVLPDGFKLKKGDSINYVPYAMGRMPYLWGSDATDFRPERWLDDNGIFQPQSPFKFTAFQGGPRICLGKDFAYVQMKIAAALLVRFFKFRAVEGKEVRYRPMLTLHMNGLNLHVAVRAAAS